MQKFRFLFIALALCLLLSSCATVEDLPPDMIITPTVGEDTAPKTENQEQSIGFRQFISDNLFDVGVYQTWGAVWNHLVITPKAIVIDLEKGETFSVCHDPLCDHLQKSCVRMMLMGGDAIVPSGECTADDLTFYLMRNKGTLAGELNNQVLRYHFQTGEVTVLAENLPYEITGISGRGSVAIDPWTDTLFINQISLDETGENENFVYILNGKTGKLDILPTFDMMLTAKYAIGDVVYFQNESSNGNPSYCLDLSQKELVLQETDMVTDQVVGKYAFYKEETGVERIYVADDYLAICEKYGKQPYQDFSKYNVYRVDILQENAAPELVAEGVADFGTGGDYVYYYEFAPQYLGTVLIKNDFSKPKEERIQLFDPNDPNAPERAALRNMFVSQPAPIHILDADTLQEVALIDSAEYTVDAWNVTFVGDGVFVNFDRTNFVQRTNYVTTQTETLSGYLYFNKPVLDENDLVVFDIRDLAFPGIIAP